MNDELILLTTILPDLRPKGHEFVALCPFHNETKPSFHVNLEKRLFYCFGCGIGGTFETLFRKLKLSPEQFTADRQFAPSIKSVLEHAQRFFREQLRANNRIRAILRERGRDIFVDRFGLGYAPADPKALREALAGFSDELLIKSGLFTDKLYPLLRDRITIPIRNLDGTIVAFAGRAVDDATQSPKYLNTRNSPLFNKSASLYLLDVAINLTERAHKLYIVEGYFDAMALNYIQIPAVAIMGSRLTIPQIVLLKGILSKIMAKTKVRPKLILLLDSDEAGLSAAVETAAQLIAMELDFEIGILPTGCDPEEIAVRNQMFTVKEQKPVLAIATLLNRLKPDPKRAAKLLLELPMHHRQQVFKLLRVLRASVGETYLRLLQTFMKESRIKELRKIAPKLSLDELITASVLQDRLEVAQLPEGYLELMRPRELSLILKAIAENKPVPPQVEALAAKLAFQQVFVDTESLIQAALAKVLKHQAVTALTEAKFADPTQFESLRQRFREAQQALEAMRKPLSIDDLV